MYNNNAFAGVRFLPPGINDGARYLVVTKSEAYAVTSENSASKVYPYELKVAYKKASAALPESLTIYSQNTGINTLQAIPMEKVSAELTYKGVKENKTFDIVYRLVDENGNGVNGQYGNVNFENGNGSKTELKNGDTFNLGWIPQGYKLTTVSVLPSDTSDPDANRYQKKITHNDANWAINSALEVGGGETLKYELDDPLRTVKIGLTHDGVGSHSNDEFDVTITLIEPDGSLSNERHKDSNGIPIQFTNGKYTAKLGNGDELVLTSIKNGSKVTVASEFFDRIQYAVLYNEKDVLGTTYDGSDSDVKLPKSPVAVVTKSTSDPVAYGSSKENLYNVEPNANKTSTMIEKDEGFDIALRFKKLTTTIYQSFIYTISDAGDGSRYCATSTIVKLYLKDPNDKGLKIPLEYEGTRQNTGSDKRKASGGYRQWEEAAYYGQNSDQRLNTTFSTTKSDGKTDTGEDFNISWNTAGKNNIKASDQSNIETYNETRPQWNKNLKSRNTAASIKVKNIPLEYELCADISYTITAQRKDGTSDSTNGMTLKTLVVDLNGYPILFNNDPTTEKGSKTISIKEYKIDATREKNNLNFKMMQSTGSYVSSPIINVLKHGNPNTEVEYFIGALASNAKASSVSATTGDGYDQLTENKIKYSAYTDKNKIFRDSGSVWQGKMTTKLSSKERWAIPNLTASSYTGIAIRPKIKEDPNNSDVTKRYQFYDETTNLSADLRSKGYYIENIEYKEEVKSSKTANTKYSYLAFGNTDEAYLRIVYDIIPQYVNIKLDASQKNGNYINRNKRFPVKLVLLDDNGKVVRNQSYVLCDEDKNALTSMSFEAASDDMELKDGSVELNFNGNDGAILNMKTSENFWLRLPYGYTVIASEPEDAIGPYTLSYETKWEDKADGQWNDSATLATDNTTNRVTIGKDLQFNTVDVNVAGVDKKQYQIVITNTRNDVEDDLGLFGGKANRAFLAFVGILSVSAAGAYIYTKRNEEAHDTDE